LSYWVIDGFEVAGAPRYGIDLRDTDHMTVQNCYVHNSTVTGIFLAFCYHPLIQFNQSAGNGEHGIYQSNSGDFPTIRGNTLHHNFSAGIHMNGDRNFTPGKMKTRMTLIEQSIAEYLQQLDRMDRKETPSSPRSATRLKERIATLKDEMHRLEGLKAQMEASPDGQVSLTDPDARSMASQGKGTGIVGYNVQTAVDAEHHLIVAHEVTNQGHDRSQLAPMALKAQEATGNKEITVLADRGYFSGDQVLSCEGTGVAPIVPKTLTSSGTKRGLFTRQDFIYDAERDHYTCPAGAKLTKIHRRADHTEDFDRYRHLSACVTCPLRPRCTPTPRRIIKRWENEDVLDRMQARLDRMPEAMGVRRQTVEHPFGTLKAWMGATHFLTRTLDKVRTEMSLHVLAYNIKRVIAIIGVEPLMAAIRT